MLYIIFSFIAKRVFPIKIFYLYTFLVSNFIDIIALIVCHCSVNEMSESFI